MERWTGSAACATGSKTEILKISGTGVNGSDDGKYVPRVANTTNIWFDQVEGEALVIALDLKGVAVSAADRRATRARPSRATC